MVEFTGERVIPGHVNDDLWSEHLARYSFAERYAHGKRVLDAGCGTGYGSAELAQSAAHVTGIDLSTEALAYAAANYPFPHLRFIAASCTQLPFRNGAFDLVAGFEVIEHLTEYRSFLHESARVLAEDGLFIVSTPNKLYYAESREQAGPNPFHEHEFEVNEFITELERVFPRVVLLLQNRVEAFAFYPASTFWKADANVRSGRGYARDAHFLIALCTKGASVPERSFVYVPQAANLLREREQHVQALHAELHAAREERDHVLDLLQQQKQELEAHNAWAERLNEELRNVGEQLVNEQARADEMTAVYEDKIVELEQENQARLEWGTEIEDRLTRQLQECVQLLDRAEASVVERTHWAQRVESQRQELEALLSMIRSSRWVRLGRKLGVGPAASDGLRAGEG